MKDKLGNTLRNGCIVVVSEGDQTRISRVTGALNGKVRLQEDPTGEDDRIFFTPTDVIRLEEFFKK